MKSNRRYQFISLLAALQFSASSLAAPYVFTSPPREKPEKGMQDYGPVADYLTKVTGKKFIYRHSKNWLSYMKDMQEDVYDMIFDGPHFVSWRVEQLNHTPLVRLPGGLEFVIISRTEDRGISQLSDLAGYAICGHAPPNLATVTAQAQFKNPARQPLIREVRGFKNVYLGAVQKKICRGAVIPAKVYKKFNKNLKFKGKARILFHSKALPHQAISVSPKIPKELQAKIADALLAKGGIAATRNLRVRFAGGKQMIPTNRNEYVGYAYLLKDFWGFEQTAAATAGQ